ncbi:hypothetical protein [Candidatus Tisiphia endosymbiont of Parasteatoda lunata]|uniref:hypothetical protein n=1 Tax=Candidatus Tisiphia endosymbiont of Parasteatoda lunata TaxID=3066275 RepID=UPI00313D829E
MIRYLKFMLKRRTASAGFFSQSGTINKAVYLALAVNETGLIFQDKFFTNFVSHFT